MELLAQLSQYANVIANIDLVLQLLLLATVLIAAYLARFKHDTRTHCKTLRIAVAVQIAVVFSVMLPAMAGFLSGNPPINPFNVEMVVHHSLGLAVIGIWIYANLVLLGKINGVGPLAVWMRTAFSLWMITIALGIHIYLVTYVLV